MESFQKNKPIDSADDYEKPAAAVENADVPKSLSELSAKENCDGDGDRADVAKPHLESDDDDEYPSGFPLIILVAACLTGVFLIALDQVCSSSTGAAKHECGRLRFNSYLDHCWHCCTQDYGRFPQS